MIRYSIVITAFNQKAYLQKALEAIRKQINNPKIYELIITDDGSTDGTDEFVKKLRYPIFLKYIRSDKPQGRAVNRNRGFERAAGEWIIFIDGDMVPSAGFIEAYQNAWDEFPNTVCVGSWVPPDEWKNIPYLRYLSSRGRLVMNHGDTIPGKYFTSGNFSIRKETLNKLGGFDIEYRGWGGEDTDLGFQLENRSISLIYIPKALCSHYHQKTLTDVLEEYSEFGKSGFPILARKYPDRFIFEKGWLLGLPGPNNKGFKKIIGLMLWPLRSMPVLILLRRIAQIKQGMMLNDIMFDWLFYGFLARGYRNRAK